MEAGWTVYNQFEWHKSYTTSRMARKLAKQIAGDRSAKKASQQFTEACKQGSVASKTQPTPM